MDKRQSRLRSGAAKWLKSWRASLTMTAGLLTAVLGSGQTPHTLLWEISGNGMTKPSYLFGTMHVLCSEGAVLSDGLKSAIASCDQVYFEIDLSDMSHMLDALKYMRMNDGAKLSDLLPPAEYQRVKTYFEKHPPMLPFGMLERFKPMLISSLIEESSLGCQTTDGMELRIMKELHAKPIKGLETIEFQAALFDSIPYKEQAKELVNYVDSSDDYKRMTVELANTYKEQNLDKIDSLSRKGDAGMSNYMDLLLYGRNRKWAETLTKALPQHSLLIAVGAAHLPGNEGIIDLLRKKGFTLKPLKN